jgi:organic hydroperoxide reductase OsmC/OhrA
MGLSLTDVRVSVAIEFDGTPVRATDARMSVHCVLADGSDPSLLIERAKAATTIGNSLREGIPVTISEA